MVWKLGRPWWPLAVLAITANFVAALFEGSTIGALTVALQLLGSPEGSSLQATFGPLGQWLDQFQPTLGRETLFLSIILFAVLAQVLRSSFQFCGQATTSWLRTRVQGEAHHRIFSHIMNLPFDRVSRYRLGDLTDHLNQSARFHEIIGSLNELIRNALYVAVYGLLLVWLSLPLTLAAGVLYLLTSALLKRLIHRVRYHADRFTEYTVQLSEKTTEMIQAIRLIHTYGRQDQVTQEVDKLTQEGMANRRKATILSNTMEPITDINTVIGAACILIGGFMLMQSGGAMHLPHLLAFLVALYRVAPRLRTAFASTAWLTALSPNLVRMQEILGQSIDPVRSEHKPSFSSIKQGITFDEVTLHYLPKEPAAVEQLSIHIPRGSFTAVVGSSGAGKSTVADLLIQLYRPTQGKILVDGQPLEAWDLTSWRASLGVVSQTPFLFHESIRKNILFGKPEATEEEVRQAAQAAHADGFIARLNAGYDTIIGDRGYRLSGGQNQRLALARALIRKPELLILDEATSALDSESERLIQKTFEEQKGSRTLLVIAHRLSTIAKADQILVLDQGRLAEKGAHEELLAEKGIYARLWALQSKERPAPETELVEAHP